jgi:tRNA(adenine34) deaminase
MTPEDLVALAADVAEEGLEAGELPIGAVVALGDEILGRSFAMERSQRRRLVHADLLAMEQADRALSGKPRAPRGLSGKQSPLRLAVNLEPCLMCLGAAMALVVDEIYFGLEAPSDGAAGVAAVWQPVAPDAEFCRIPPLTGGIHRARCLDQFRRYVRAAPESGFRTWAQGLASLPD